MVGVRRCSKGVVATAVAALLALPILVGSCGGAPGDPEVVPTTVEGYPIVRQDRLRFIPRELTIPVRQSVLFRNSETAVHDVLVDGVNVSGVMRKGDEVLYTFERPGSYRITCSFHPQMRATIVVEAAASEPTPGSN